MESAHIYPKLLRDIGLENNDMLTLCSNCHKKFDAILFDWYVPLIKKLITCLSKKDVQTLQKIINEINPQTIEYQKYVGTSIVGPNGKIVVLK